MATLRYDPMAVRRLLDERHWTLDTASRRSRVRRDTLAAIARRGTRPRADTLAKLAQGFDVPIGAFFTGGKPSNGSPQRGNAPAALTTP